MWSVSEASLDISYIMLIGNATLGSNGLLSSHRDSTTALPTKNIPFHLPCNSAMSDSFIIVFCISKMNDLCASSGLKCSALPTTDAHSAHCSVSRFKCRKFIPHASLILSCICIVWNLRCWLWWKKNCLFTGTEAKADTEHFAFRISFRVSLQYLSGVNKSRSRWKMTFHIMEALVFSDQHAEDYLVQFQSWNVTGKVIIISKSATKWSKFWHFPKSGLSSEHCSLCWVHALVDQRSVRLWDVVHSFWSQMWRSLQLHFSTCLAWILHNQSDSQRFADV